MPRVTAAQMHLATIAFQNGHQNDALARLLSARKRAAPEFLIEIDYEIGNCLTYLGRDEEARVLYLDLIEAGWPGEKMQHEAATLRVYTTIRRLRGLGLGDVLVTRDEGYLLDPEVAVRTE